MQQIIREAWMSLKKPQGKIFTQPTTNIFAQIYGFAQLKIRWFLSHIPGFSWLYDKTRISALHEKHIFRLPDLRPLFEHQFTSLPLMSQSKNHTHAAAAAERTGANIALVELSRDAGFRPYVVSQSNSDYNMNIDGSRSFYWPKDLSVPYRDDPVLEKDCLIFIDTDFHCDMNKYLDMFKPMLIYTFAPKTVAGQFDEYSFQILNNRVYYTVKGGASYSHEIWDYRGDCITKIDDDGALLTFDITQKEIDNSGRRIVFIMPRTYTPWPYYLHLNVFDGLIRRAFSMGMVNVVYDVLTDQFSIGMQTSPYHVQLPGRTISALKHRLESKKTKTPEIGDIEVYLHNEKAVFKELKLDCPEALNNIKNTASLLHEALPHLPSYLANVVPTSSIPTTYVALGPLATVDCVDAAVLITTPLVDWPAIAPGKHPNNEIAAVNGRVLKVINNAVPNREYKKFATEFVRKIIPVPGIGSAITYEEVIELQNKTAQRARAELVFDTLAPFPRNSLETFNKGEAYPGLADPRIITTMKPKLTIEMSRFTIPFKKQVLLNFDWYAPGKQPKELLNLLRKFGQNGFIDTDYTRFDGSISKWLQRNIVLSTYMRWIDPNQATMYKACFDQVFQQTARTTSGLRYQSGFGTRSGSPITTDGNTIINAFIVYASLRNIGYTADNAWLNLGLYAGDDGLSPMLSGLQQSLIDVSKHLGLVVKIDSHLPNDPVPFLGRIIPRPLSHYDSYQDPIRTIPKLHLSFNKQVPIEQAGFNKAIGYITTDLLTPIISDWAIKVIDLSNIKSVKHQLDEEMWKLHESNAWPQEDGELIRTDFCRLLNISSVELDECVAAIHNVVGSFPLQMPIITLNECKNKLDGLCGDQVHATTGNRVDEITLECPKIKNNLRNRTPRQKRKAASTSEKPSKNITHQEKNGKQREFTSSQSIKKNSSQPLSLSAKSCSQNQSTPRNISSYSKQKSSVAVSENTKSVKPKARRVSKRPSHNLPSNVMND
nr:RNA-dependent RNA polymerase [Nodaviridae sp.]